MKRILIVILALILVVPMVAQEDDEGFDRGFRFYFISLQE